MLEYLENKYLSLSLKIKIEFYLVLILLGYFAIYQIDLKFQSQITTPKNFYENLENKVFSKDIEFIKKLEKFCIKSKIKISKIENKKTIILLGSTSLKKLPKLIFFIENENNFSNIKYVSLDKKTSSIYDFKINIDFSKYYIKNKVFLKNKKQKKQKYKLYAIVGNNVLVNDKWLELNAKIDDYKIVKIKKNFIELQSKIKTLKLEIRKNDKFNKLYN